MKDDTASIDLFVFYACCGVIALALGLLFLEFWEPAANDYYE